MSRLIIKLSIIVETSGNNLIIPSFNPSIFYMEIIFLGTGTSQGVPIIAQPEEGCCDLKNKKNWRTRTSIHVVMDGFHFQVDCSPEFRLQCIDNKVEQIDYFLLTHYHSDHIVGMDDLRRFCDLREDKSIPVYGDESSLRRVKEIFPYAINDKPAAPGYPCFKLHDMPQVLETDGGTVTRVTLPHGPFDVYGFIFQEKSSGKKFAYYTDCSAVDGEALELARGSDMVVLDALRKKPHPSHMTIDEATEVAKAIAAPQTYFIHMTYGVDYDQFEEKSPEGIHLSYDGLRYVI